jgi:hypothetical protein
MAQGGAPGPALSPGRSGVYSGVAYPLDTAGGLCITNKRITGFEVRGNKVRWGGFRGTIDGSGLQMVYGNTWFFGQFEGDVFQGQISSSGPRGGPGCTFSVQLAKTGN